MVQLNGGDPKEKIHFRGLTFIFDIILSYIDIATIFGTHRNNVLFRMPVKVQRLLTSLTQQ